MKTVMAKVADGVEVVGAVVGLVVMLCVAGLGLALAAGVVVGLGIWLKIPIVAKTVPGALFVEWSRASALFTPTLGPIVGPFVWWILPFGIVVAVVKASTLALEAVQGWWKRVRTRWISAEEPSPAKADPSTDDD